MSNSNSNFSERLTQALNALSEQTSRDDNVQLDNFSGRLQSLLSQLEDSSESSDSESINVQRQAPNKQAQKRKRKVASSEDSSVEGPNRPSQKQKRMVISSEEEVTSSDTPENTPERTEDEFVPESPEITYQFVDGDENQEQEESDPAGE
jgi:hypothetical protein